jgi:FAD/FMN-containing dehydrogenase
MNAAFASGRHFAEVHPRDPLYRDLQLRGYNRRFVGTPDSVFVVNDTNQVMNAVDAAVASGKKLAVRSGGHCTEGLVDDPAVRCLIDLGQMDSVYYDRHRRAFAVEAGADDRSCVPSAGYELGRDPARR